MKKKVGYKARSVKRSKRINAIGIRYHLDAHGKPIKFMPIKS